MKMIQRRAAWLRGGGGEFWDDIDEMLCWRIADIDELFCRVVEEQLLKCQWKPAL